MAFASLGRSLLLSTNLFLWTRHFNSNAKTKCTIPALFAITLFAGQTLACVTGGTTCPNVGATACACNNPKDVVSTVPSDRCADTKLCEGRVRQQAGLAESMGVSQDLCEHLQCWSLHEELVEIDVRCSDAEHVRPETIDEFCGIT